MFVQFISTATGRDSPLDHGLDPVTSQISAVRNSSPGPTDVVLVDTPGIDDIDLSDLQNLELVSDWLQDTCVFDLVLLSLSLS